MYRGFVFLMVVAVFFVTSPSRRAHGVETAQQSRQTAKSNVSSTTVPKTYEDIGMTHRDRSGGKLAGDWRYVHHNGRNWYWMPNKTWSVWSGGAWIPYSTGMFSPAATGYGRQVTGYRGVPANEEIRQPMNASVPAGRQYSSPGPSMPNEHFMHP
jgi:hypothetical protein